MGILELPHSKPGIILLDWHATLVDTHDAMYHAVDDVLPRLDELGLREHMLTPDQSKTIEDAKLVKYVRAHKHLHPKIKIQRKISRSDIFEVLFGSDLDAKSKAHKAFDAAYRDYVGDVSPLEPDTRFQLIRLRALGIFLGVISNRNREFMEHEMSVVEQGSWVDLFDTMACGNDVQYRKPNPDLIWKALEYLGASASEQCWYVGDSTTDIVAAKDAGVTAVFYNGAHWPQTWLDKIFPGTTRHPHRPDAVVESMSGLVELARHMLAQDKRVARAQE